MARRRRSFVWGVLLAAVVAVVVLVLFPAWYQAEECGGRVIDYIGAPPCKGIIEEIPHPTPTG
ncbi:MAG: hypothetical protein ACRDJ4_06870 [Actinomycetota bacterium]